MNSIDKKEKISEVCPNNEHNLSINPFIFKPCPFSKGLWVIITKLTAAVPSAHTSPCTASPPPTPAEVKVQVQS